MYLFVHTCKNVPFDSSNKKLEKHFQKRSVPEPIYDVKVYNYVDCEHQ